MQVARPLASEVRAAAAAVAFLTRVPVGRRLALDAGDVGRGAWFFPLVGAGVGALAGLVAIGLDGRLPGLAVGGIAVALALLLTGAFHLDALADTADAVAAPDRARALEIMRDPRVGTFGCAAIVVDLLLKTSAVAVLAGTGSEAVAALAVAGSLSRAAALPLARLLPYARAEGGPGSVLTGRVRTGAALIGVTVAVALTLGLLSWAGVAAALAAAAFVAAVSGLGCRRWLGGVTGDTLGATTEASETLVLLVLAGLA